MSSGGRIRDSLVGGLALLSAAVLHVGVAFGQTCIQRPADMVSWWSGSGHTDDTQDSNPGTLENGAAYGTAIVLQGFSFDGVNDFVKVPLAPNLNAGAQVTLEAWMRGDPANPMNSCCQGVVTTDHYLLGIGAGGLYFAVVTENGVAHTSDNGQGTYSLTPGVWYHVSGTYDGSNVKLHVNGVEVRSTPHTGTIPDMGNASFLVIGSEDGRSTCPFCQGTRYFKGIVDEVGLYARALTSQEIGQIHAAGNDGKCGNPSQYMLVASSTIPGSSLSNNGPIIRYAFDGTGSLRSYSSIPEDELEDPAGAAFGPDGELFVGNRRGNVGMGEGSISRFIFDSSGGFAPNGTITGNGLEAVHGLEFCPNGELFAANWLNNSISRFRFGPDGAPIPNGTIATGSGNFRNLGLACSQTNELFLTRHEIIGDITYVPEVLRYRLDPATGSAVSNGSFTIPGSSRPHFLQFNRGELFIPDVDTDLVYRYLFSSSGMPIPNGTVAVGGGPVSVAFSPENEMFVSSHFVGAITRLLFDGAGAAVPNGSTATRQLGGLAVTSFFDNDGDGRTYLEDCDDRDPCTHPGAQEICDGKDNDCDGALDEGGLPPPAVRGLSFLSDAVSIVWLGCGATTYDVVKGDLQSLAATRGDFRTSLIGCLEDDSPDTRSTDSVIPSSGGIYYVTRANGTCGPGTYDEGSASQQGSRDSGISASSVACP